MGLAVGFIFLHPRMLRYACGVRFIRNYDLLLFGVLLQRVLIQSANVDFIIPRGGGRRDREGFANPSLPLQHLSTLPGEPLRRDITADREGL